MGGGGGMQWLQMTGALTTQSSKLSVTPMCLWQPDLKILSILIMKLSGVSIDYADKIENSIA